MSDFSEVTVTVLYSCHLCGLIKIPVEVKARGEENISAWMDFLGHALADDHQKRNPNCHPKTFSSVMIPMAGTDKVGGPAIN